MSQIFLATGSGWFYLCWVAAVSHWPLLLDMGVQWIPWAPDTVLFPCDSKNPNFSLITKINHTSPYKHPILCLWSVSWTTWNVEGAFSVFSSRNMSPLCAQEPHTHYMPCFRDKKTILLKWVITHPEFPEPCIQHPASTTDLTTYKTAPQLHEMLSPSRLHKCAFNRTFHHSINLAASR